MKINIGSIQLEQSAQCRASMSQEVIDDYTQAMIDGEQFPPIEVYGTAAKCWLADGWHRVLAARQAVRETIEATVNHGGRTEAVRHALKANSLHGLRRSNADKRRSVEIALREFGNLSSRAVADMCGVNDKTVKAVKNTCGISAPDTILGQDGKAYPASKPETTAASVAPSPTSAHRPTRPPGISIISIGIPEGK